jgi:putative ABC transport system substrate-binding protein
MQYTLASLICAALLLSICLADAQPTAKVFRIGVLRNDTPALFASRNNALRQGLRELGYSDGNNIRFEYRYAEGKRSRMQELAAELVKLNVDIIVVGGGTVSAAKNATARIAIVVGSAGDLVGDGYVASLAKPGGNITGLTDISPDVSGKRLELLKQIIPRAQRLAVVFHGKTAADENEVKQTEVAASELSVKIQRVVLDDPPEFSKLSSAIAREQANGLIFIQGGGSLRYRKELSLLAIKLRLPSICETAIWTEDGCLMNYGPDLLNLWRRAATYVDKILKGANPAELPVEQPTKFELVINLNTAKQIGLRIPPNLLARANKVIK